MIKKTKTKPLKPKPHQRMQLKPNQAKPAGCIPHACNSSTANRNQQPWLNTELEASLGYVTLPKKINKTKSSRESQVFKT